MSNITTNEKRAKLSYQFSILSPERFEMHGVQIENRDTYINNKPVIGGLFDLYGCSNRG